MVRGGSDGVRAKVLVVRGLWKQKGLEKEERQKNGRKERTETKGNGKGLGTREKAQTAAE